MVQRTEAKAVVLNDIM